MHITLLPLKHTSSIPPLSCLSLPNFVSLQWIFPFVPLKKNKKQRVGNGVANSHEYMRRGGFPWKVELILLIRYP
jgi:hypothetical protein